MDFNIKDLMNKGMSADDIAAAFTNELNSALEEQKAKDSKREEFNKIMDLLVNWFKTYYPEIEDDMDDSFKDETYDEIYNGIESIVALALSLAKADSPFTAFFKANGI